MGLHQRLVVIELGIISFIWVTTVAVFYVDGEELLLFCRDGVMARGVHHVYRLWGFAVSVDRNAHVVRECRVSYRVFVRVCFFELLFVPRVFVILYNDVLVRVCLLTQVGCVIHCGAYLSMVDVRIFLGVGLAQEPF